MIRRLPKIERERPPESCIEEGDGDETPWRF